MRHAFSFPEPIREAVRRHVREAYTGLAAKRFNQEPAWVAAVAARMEGVAYDGPDGRVVFSSTLFDDRGRGSAERRFGADLAVTADISDGRTTIIKAILFQAKLGAVQDLDDRQAAGLRDQVLRMQQLTPAPKVLEIPTVDGHRKPRILSGVRLLADEVTRGVPMEDYFTRRVLPTLDGDTRPWFVDAVQDSSLTRIHVHAVRDSGRVPRLQASLFD